jgi:hypothetical protein
LFVAVSFFILSFQILPGGRPVPQRAKAAVAMEQMREIAHKLGAGRAPMVTLDPWCNPYEVDSSTSGVMIVSYGGGGKRDVPPSQNYSVGSTRSFAGDLVLLDGRFIRYPEGMGP